MEIEEFIKYICSSYKLGKDSYTRGNIIDLISHHEDRWIMVLKALLIKNIQTQIATSYLLNKLRFMKENPDQPECFLDLQGTIIFSALIEG